MTLTSFRPTSIRYPARTIARAERALRCAPFYLQLFVTMAQQSVSLGTIAGLSGVQRQYSRRNLTELAVEQELLWLIQVGLLRREVDGQGLTDSFRLTPLGRQIVERWQQRGTRSLAASWLDRSRNFIDRWLRLPL